MNIDKLTDKMCIGAARVCRTLCKPSLGAKIDVECEIYSDDECEKPVVNTKIKCEPRVKLINLALGLVAARAVYRLFRELFKD